jgi:hypothetical protein
MKQAGGGAWDDLKKGVDSAVEDLKTAVQGALSRYKEKKV